LWAASLKILPASLVLMLLFSEPPQPNKRLEPNIKANIIFFKRILLMTLQNYIFDMILQMKFKSQNKTKEQIRAAKASI